MSEQRSRRLLSSLTAGLVIGTVELVLAISFAALVFGGYLAQFLADGIGLNLVAAALTLAILAWRAGARGSVGSVQDAAAAVLAVIATNAALDAFGSLDRAFLTVVAATVVVTTLTGVTFLVLGTFRWGNLVRFVPYPVVGGFLAGTGWLLAKGGLGVASGIEPYLRNLHYYTDSFVLVRWLPALGFGVLLLVATRLVKRSLVIPAVLGIGVVGFAIGMLVTGSSIETAREGGWLLGPFETTELWQPWAFRALSGADWTAVIDQAAGIATAVFVAVIAALFNLSGIELMLHTDLDSNQELGGAGIVNIATGAVGGLPGYHALSLTSLAQQMDVSARVAGMVAALVPLTVVVFGASLVELIPRMIVGGVLVFVGLGFIVDRVIDARKTLPLGEYVIVLAILATIITRGLLPGVAVGLVLAVVMFAVNYSRMDLVREVAFGDTYRSNVDRPLSERAALRTLGERVQILRVHGFVFFGTASGLLERIRKRVERGPLRFLLVDLARVTGMDSSAVMSFRKVAQLAEANGFGLVFAGASDVVRRQLERGARRGCGSRLVRARPGSRTAAVRGRPARGRCRGDRPGHVTGRIRGRARRHAPTPAGLSGARGTAGRNAPDPPGRVARRPVRPGVGRAPDRVRHAGGEADAPAHRTSQRDGGRDRPVHGGPPHRGRGGRDAVCRPAAQPRVDRADGGTGARGGRGDAPLGRQHAGGAIDRHDASVRRPARLALRRERSACSPGARPRTTPAVRSSSARRPSTGRWCRRRVAPRSW